MGCCPSKKNDEQRVALRTSTKIDKDLDKNKKEQDYEIKILLLGPGESGKSTLFKQMQLIQDRQFDEEYLQSFIPLIRQNLVSQMKVLLESSDRLGVPIQKQEYGNLIKKTKKRLLWNEEIATALSELWEDSGIQKSLEFKDKKFHLYDSTEYFFDEIERVSSEYYLPTNEDVLRTRVKSIAVEEAKFRIGKYILNMIDVGGQRSERRKWIHCFEEVTSIIFCVSLTGYHQTLIEDNSVNRIEEALNLFSDICKSPWFLNSSIILFLNKKDLFQEDIKKTDLSVCFSEYKGGKDYENAIAYIQEQFMTASGFKTNQSKREVYPFVTCALNTENIEFVIKAALDTIMRNNLKYYGIY
ncbi:guanine nucleotide-binding protein g(o) subunit alpha [Anaeramoeba flamelloides]|uniref:Guanine nucleotide-binding protein g(O) subunit alpha n=1 Tax=Anaeramoeba flamelloides TaxID=1746091 RepID=A0AAV7ZST9_9EUKA|nr:guanine nucleotide-binding protein g(o) subunit alpha [Anaeramoeba flamelloides]KAJ6252202.1 guanine nucleotide-binding protein g(o) subunit alpha [Anaeramoeba flamelloides]